LKMYSKFNSKKQCMVWVEIQFYSGETARNTREHVPRSKSALALPLGGNGRNEKAKQSNKCKFRTSREVTRVLA
jgi:hypothetical protein